MFYKNRHTRTRVPLLLAATILLGTMSLRAAAASPAQGAAPSDAATLEKGKEIFSQTCSGCHGTTHTTIQRKSAERWRKTIYAMISRGAPVLPGEVDLLTTYLTATYGPASPPPTFAEGAAARPQQALPEGREIIVQSCGGCHAVNLIFAARKTQNAWRDTVARMRTNGASFNESAERALVDYLAQHFGL